MMDWLLHQLPSWLAFSAKQPIIFTEVAFWVFFAMVLVGYQLVHRKMALRNSYLFLISLYFYYKTSGSFFCFCCFDDGRLLCGSLAGPDPHRMEAQGVGRGQCHHQFERPILFQIPLFLR